MQIECLCKEIFYTFGGAKNLIYIGMRISKYVGRVLLKANHLMKNVSNSMRNVDIDVRLH